MIGRTTSTAGTGPVSESAVLAAAASRASSAASRASSAASAAASAVYQTQVLDWVVALGVGLGQQTVMLLVGLATGEQEWT
ncbi:hypothetical protein JRF68_10345, partial [Micrococcus luteus]|nr:hypothetical protein [Micrococcus luteus]